MPKGKSLQFKVEGAAERRTIIEVSATRPDKPSYITKPHIRATVIGMDPHTVMEFICSCISYSIARHGTLDASKWESESK